MSLDPAGWTACATWTLTRPFSAYAGIGDYAAGVLELDRGVVDAEALPKDMIYVGQD